MKKILALLCALTLLISLVPAALAAPVEYGAELNPYEKTYEQRFSDVPTNHWAFKYVADLVERGAINGYPDGKFYPDKIVTREEFAKIMVVAAGLTATPAAASSYTDVPLTYWASPFIETAKPYMTAYQNAQGLFFKPTDGALREDIAVAVVMLKGYDTRLADLSIIRTMFHDVDAISAAAQPYVALAVENGIISGYTDGTFRGQNTITRSEAAAILWRAFQYGSDTKVMPGQETVVTPKPSASPALSASPSPSAVPSPSPEPSAEPEPAEAVKPYVVETLVSNFSVAPGETDMLMTMDDDGRVIYYDEAGGEIISLSASGEKETLLDTQNATYSDAMGKYKGIDVRQVFWDNVNRKLLVDGTMSHAASEDGWETDDADQTYRAFFSLENGHLSFYADVPTAEYPHGGTPVYPAELPDMGRAKLCCALKDGTHVLQMKIFGYSELAYYVYDLRGGEERTFMGKAPNLYGYRLMTQIGVDVYAISGINLEKYLPRESSWEKVGDCGLVRCYQNGLFYACDSGMIKAIRPSDAAKQLKVDLEDDVEIKDLWNLPDTADALFVTPDEQYIIYDYTARAIRVIRPNPEAAS